MGSSLPNFLICTYSLYGCELSHILLSSFCELRGKAPFHLAPNSNNPRGWLIQLGTHVPYIVSHSFEPVNRTGGMSYCIWPDLGHPVATWLVTVIDSSIRIKIRVDKWMREKEFSNGRKGVTGRQKQWLSTRFFWVLVEPGHPFVN